MKYDLLVDASALGNVSSNSTKYANEVNVIIKQLQNEITNIDNAWQGAEVNNFKSNIEKLANSLLEISNCYGEFGNLLNQVNTRYEEVDGECAKDLFRLENR